MSLPLFDILAAAVFAVFWLGYEPLLRRLGEGRLINTDMTVIRRAWMVRMSQREMPLLDGQLLGHAINSASFFASSNLLLIAAAAGVLFGGDKSWSSIQSLDLLAPAGRLLFEGKMALVLITLARGLLDFIWSIRQMNYCLAAIGAAPHQGEAWSPEYGEAAAGLLNPALSSFNAGVRGYYFALASAAWLLGPLAFLTATVGAIMLLIWRQRRSRASDAVRRLRNLLEQNEA